MKAIGYVFLITFLLTILTNSLLACKCKSSDFADQYNADKIFIGKIIAVDLKQEYFTVQVIENFKGNNIDTLYANYDNCSIYPSKDAVWLIYANVLHEDTIYISQCGFSKNFGNPVNLNLFNTPQPYLSGILSYSDSLLLETMNRNSVYSELYFQIEGLKLKKNNAILNEVKENLKEMEIAQDTMFLITSFFLLIIIILTIKLLMVLSRIR